MRFLKLTIIGILLFVSGALNAQVNVNIGTAPQWGPAGYSNVRYYYLPDAETYYDVHTSQFIYLENGRWVHHSNLPGRYRNYNLYSGYKVVMVDYHGNSPYENHNSYKIKYKKGYKGGSQKTIGQHPGNKNANGKSNSPIPTVKQSKPANNKSTGAGNVKSSQGNNGKGQKNQGGGKGKNK